MPSPTDRRFPTLMVEAARARFASHLNTPPVEPESSPYWMPVQQRFDADTYAKDCEVLATEYVLRPHRAGTKTPGVEPGLHRRTFAARPETGGDASLIRLDKMSIPCVESPNSTGGTNMPDEFSEGLIEPDEDDEEDDDATALVDEQGGEG